MPPKRKAARAAASHQGPGSTSQGRSFSLGANLFGFPAARGCGEPQQQPPEAWLVIFRAQHATSPVLSGLADSCKTGRAMVLSQAPIAILSLNTTDEQPQQAWLAKLAMAKEGLVTRGPLPTTIRVYVGSSANSDTQLLLIPQALQGAGAGVTELEVIGEVKSNTLAQFLQQMSAVTPNITRLECRDCNATLPPPPAFPQLRELSMQIPSGYDWMDEEQANQAANAQVLSAATLFTSLAPYVCSQLTHLSLQRKVHNEEMEAIQHQLYNWEQLFTQPSTTLTHLSLTACVTDSIVETVMERAPSLTHLGLSDFYREFGDHSDQEWSLEELTITYGDMIPGLSDLCNLPRQAPNANTLRIEIRSCHGASDFTFDPVAEASLPARLAQWEIKADSITLNFISGWPDMHDIFPALQQAEDQLVADMQQALAINPAAVQGIVQAAGGNVAALHQVLSQCAHLRAPEAVVEFTVVKKEWTQAMVAVVSAMLPELPHLKFGVCTGGRPLTDSLLRIILSMGPCIRVLQASHLKLTTDHSTTPNTVWPWDELRVSECDDMTQLLKLPSPAGRDTPPEIVCGTVTACIDKASDATRVCNWLSHVRWAATTVTLLTPGRNKALHNARMSVMRAMRFTTPVAESATDVVLRNWSLTRDNMDALRGLPEWAGVLDLRSCKWPLMAREYTHLGMCVPTSYIAWRMGETVPAARLKAICEGVNQRRAGLDLPRLELCIPSFMCVEEQVGDHVTVTMFGWGFEDWDSDSDSDSEFDD